MSDEPISQAELVGATGAQTADEVLDLGAGGLRYFENWLPILARVVDLGDKSWVAACGRYDEQRGMSFGVLRTDAEALDQAAQELTLQQQVLDAQVEEMSEVWEGDSAAAALTYLQDVGAGASTAQVWVADACAALTEAADELELAVRDKASMVGQMYTGEIDGWSRDQVETIVTVAGGAHDNTDNDERMMRIAHWFPDVGSSQSCGELTEESRTRAIELCREWVDRTFAPNVDATWRAFDETCTETAEAVRLIYRAVQDTVARADPALLASLSSGIDVSGTTDGTQVRSTGVDELLEGDGAGAIGSAAGPAVGDEVSGPTITVADDGLTMEISATDAEGASALVTVLDDAGDRIEVGLGGTPQLAAVPAEGAPVDPAAGGAGAGSATSSSGAGEPDSQDVPAPMRAVSVSEAVEALAGRAQQDGEVGPGGSGATLASAGAGSGGPTGATLAGAGGTAGSGPAGSSTAGSGPAGSGTAGSGGGESSRPASQWQVLDDTFAADSHSWSRLVDVLGGSSAAGDSSRVEERN